MGPGWQREGRDAVASEWLSALRGLRRWRVGLRRGEGEGDAGRGAKQAAVGRCAVERAEPVSSDLIRWIEIRRIRSNRYAI